MHLRIEGATFDAEMAGDIDRRQVEAHVWAREREENVLLMFFFCCLVFRV